MDKRLARLIKTIRGGQNDPVMLDTYNQAIHEDVACTIRTNINTANHHFIMEKIDKVGTIHKGQSGVVYGQDGIAPTITTNKGDGQLIAEPVIIQRDHGYNSGGEFKEVAPTITGSTWHFNNVIKEPLVFGWTRDSREKIVDRHPVEVANCVTAAKRDNTQNYVVEKYRIRKLTERECFRLMGVSEEDIDKLIYHSGFIVWNGKKYVQVPRISKSRLYKLAGNSIVVDVLVEIFKQLFSENKTTDKQLKLF